MFVTLAIGDFHLKRCIGFFQMPGALADQFLQLIHSPAGFLKQPPFLGQGIGELQHFHRVERLLEDDEPVGIADPGRDAFPRIIGVSRAKNHLEIGIRLPKSGRGLNSIPARGHADVHKRHGKWLAGLLGGLDRRQTFLSLKRRRQFKVPLPGSGDGVLRIIQPGR